jgi:hypothetical protein
MSAAVFILGGGTAVADTVIVNDLITGGNVTKAQGTTGFAKVTLQTTNGTPSGDTSGCNAQTSNPVVVSLQSNNAGVTFPSGNTASLTACDPQLGSTQNVAYAVGPTASGTATISISGVSGGKTDGARLFSTSDTMVVTISAPADTTPPVIQETITGTVGNNSWYTSDVTLSWSVTDSESTITSQSGCSTVNITADQSSTDYTCMATSSGGTASKTVSIKRDATSPQTNCDAVDSLWHASNVSIACTASDAPSGLADSSDASFNLSTSVASGSEDSNASTGSRQVCDSAGNCTTAGPISGNKIDRKGPTVECNPAAADLLWHNSEQSFLCSATDGGSGVSGTDSTMLSTNVGGGNDNANASTGSHSFCDEMNNCTTAGPILGNKIDLKNPSVNCDSADANWHNANVSLACTASDSGSDLADSADASFNLSTSVASGSEDSNASTGSRQVCDSAGNCVTAGPIAGNKIDLKKPINIQFVGGPASGASYTYGSVPSAPTCTAQDGGSGLASCAVTGYGFTPGNHTLTATATDNAGNSDSIQLSYTVNPWTLHGFYSPVDMGGVVNTTVKAGSTVPLKFEIFAGTTELTSTSSISSFLVGKVSCTSFAGDPTDAIENYSTGGTSLRYDSTGGQFIQNWKVPQGANVCYKVTMTTNDGSSKTALFKTK